MKSTSAIIVLFLTLILAGVSNAQKTASKNQPENSDVQEDARAEARRRTFELIQQRRALQNPNSVGNRILERYNAEELVSLASLELLPNQQKSLKKIIDEFREAKKLELKAGELFKLRRSLTARLREILLPEQLKAIETAGGQVDPSSIMRFLGTEKVATWLGLTRKQVKRFRGDVSLLHQDVKAELARRRKVDALLRKRANKILGDLSATQREKIERISGRKIGDYFTQMRLLSLEFALRIEK